MTWTVFYKNTTASAISSVQINDKLPVGVTIAATGGQTVTVSGTGTTATKNTAYTGAATGTVSNLLAASAALGTSGVITVSIPVTINTGFTGDISNQATATGSSIPAAGTLTDNVDSTTTGLPTGVTVPAGSVAQTATAAIDPTTLTVSPPSSNLKLTKSAPAQAQANSPLTYTLTVSNIGRLATSGTTTVSDSLPTGITVNGGAAGTATTSGEAANWTCASDSASPQTITCDSTTAIAATSGTSVFAFSVDVGSTVTTNIINQAKVWGGGDPSKPAVTTTGTISACTLASENTAGSAANAGCAYESTPVVNVPGYKSVKLTTDIDSSGSITPGDTLTYTLQYANTGTIAVPAFQINDQIPSGFIISATGGQTVTVTGAGTTVTKNASYTGAAAGAVSDLLAASAVIAPGGVITITIPVTIATGATGTKSNQASATGTDLSTAVLSDNAGATADLPASVTAAPYNLTLPASSVAQTITATLDPTTLTIAGLPMIALVKSVTPTGDQPPGADLTYKIVFSNTGGAAAQKLIIFDPIPNNTDFKLGSETITPGTTGLTIIVEFSNDFVAATPTLATWTYVPASGGGGAPTGYDRNVKAVRWRVTAGNLSQIPPNHTGDAGFTVKIR